MNGEEEEWTPEQIEKLTYMKTRMDIAYHVAPVGNWKQRWIPGVCKHEQIRCVHGDEIIGRGWKRRVCLICGRALKGSLPELCFFTGEVHPYYLKGENGNAAT